jgi:hypothetical protein
MRFKRRLCEFRVVLLKVKKEFLNQAKYASMALRN